MRVRQVDWKPDEFTLVLPHPFLFHPPDRVFRLLLTPRCDVHFCTASYKVECNVQTNTRA